MPDGDKAWQRNTPEQRTKRRAAWDDWQSKPRSAEKRWNGVDKPGDPK